jgi:hypothetical protein
MCCGYVIATLILLVTSSSLNAQDQSPKILLKQGAFVVTEHSVSDQGSDLGMCIAEIKSGANLSLSFRGYQDEHFTMKIKDSRWELEDRNVSVIVDVDGDKMVVAAVVSSTEDDVLLLFDDDPLLKQRIVDKVTGGKKLRATSYGGTLLGDFSLLGSKRAMSVFAECWAGLQVSDEAPADPFAKTATVDPFAKKTTIAKPQSDPVPFKEQMFDTDSVLYAVSVAQEGTIPPNGTTGAVLQSINRSGREHQSFGMYDNCQAYSLRFGWGSFSWANGGTIVDFEGKSYTFLRQGPPDQLQLGGKCQH